MYTVLLGIAVIIPALVTGTASQACPRGDANCIIGNLNNLNQQLYQQRQQLNHKTCRIVCNSQYENDDEGRRCLSQCDDK